MVRTVANGVKVVYFASWQDARRHLYRGTASPVVRKGPDGIAQYLSNFNRAFAHEGWDRPTSSIGTPRLPNLLRCDPCCDQFVASSIGEQEAANLDLIAIDDR